MEHSRALLAQLGTPEARRDVAVSLTNVAGVAQAEGRWKDAGALYQECLEHSHALLALLGTPQARRDHLEVLDSCVAAAEAGADAAAIEDIRRERQAILGSL